MRTKDGVIGRPSLWIAEDFWVLRFRLMVKRSRLKQIWSGLELFARKK